MPSSPEAYWKAPAVARLIGRARDGETWEAIGRAFYPKTRHPLRVRTAAAEIFRRHASEDDRKARAAALRARNWNKTPGLSEWADRRRRRFGRNDVPVMREHVDPLAAFGECFL